MTFIFHSGQGARYEPIGQKRDGRPLYRVLERFGYVCTKRQPTVMISVEEGFITDLASIPSLPFMPKPGGSLWDDAAIIHDCALEYASSGAITYARADAIFYWALRARGCSTFTAAVFWGAVRLHSLVRR